MRRLRIESANLDSHIETTEDDGTATIKLKDLAKLVENGELGWTREKGNS